MAISASKLFGCMQTGKPAKLRAGGVRKFKFITMTISSVKAVPDNAFFNRECRSALRFVVVFGQHGFLNRTSERLSIGTPENKKGLSVQITP